MNSIQIGALTIDPPIFLAPMAGITNSPFRNLVLELGCPAVVTEMVSAEGIVRQNKRTLQLLHHQPTEHPLFVQLFGHDPRVMAEAVVMCAHFGFDGVDINMGCPVRKVVSEGSGVALMRDPHQARRIALAARLATRLPLTVKLRAGWSVSEINVVELAQSLADQGVDAVTIHPRTRNQFYSGKADWHLIRRVVDSVRIPVIGNGDLKVPADAERMIDETGCAGVMVGRAACGDLWLPGAMAGAPYPPSSEERLRIFCIHLEKMIEFLGSEYRAVLHMRKHAIWYTRGFPGAAMLRRRLQWLHTASEMRTAVAELMSTGG